MDIIVHLHIQSLANGGGYRNWKTLSTEVQENYILVADGSLRIESLNRLIKNFRSGCVDLLNE